MISKDILHECHKEGFNVEELYGAYRIFFGTLVSESRLKIINVLRKGKKNVSELIGELKGDQTAVSHDLRRLKDCGFVIAEREGKFVYYRLNTVTIRPMMEIIEKHMEDHCIHILRGMKGKHEES
ncbi:metalloregulator ArsR/SmtB family transcription factor [Candidatus Pacearchaeota archaeon]|nr:metalloregulator ArsR/SmtB family transcription factor [Candidatus Pacearchaeota archaeon]